eukprot:TRINITY_DN2025_c0_g1_i12.p1 TRINITY_DN2025_c0_g1~~TRINITY_DN2025_c0_g1_i12.p1  ORF type:complete len:376 (-),score=78.92 TRINITY_DN2025_c0_g1_i12:184-1311(-)
MLKVMYIMDSMVKAEKRVLVHCHAGMGRTGLVIGCYMLFSGEYDDVKKVMELVRAKRAKAFDTKKHKRFIKVFAQLLSELRVLFPGKKGEKADIDKCLKRQGYLLHGKRKKELKNCPILVHEVCERVAGLHKTKIISSENIVTAFKGMEIPDETEEYIETLKSKLNSWKWNSLHDCENPTVLLQLMLDFLEGLSHPAIDIGHIQTTSEDKQLVSPHEIGLIQCLAKVYLLVADTSDYDKVLTRLSISLLGLKSQESKNFSGREMTDAEFNNSANIEVMKAYLREFKRVDSNKVFKQSRPKPKVLLTESKQDAILSKKNDRDQSLSFARFEKSLEEKESEYQTKNACSALEKDFLIKLPYENETKGKETVGKSYLK